MITYDEEIVEQKDEEIKTKPKIKSENNGEKFSNEDWERFCEEMGLEGGTVDLGKPVEYTTYFE